MTTDELLEHAPARPWVRRHDYNVQTDGGRTVAACGSFSDNRRVEQVHRENIAAAELVRVAVNTFEQAYEALEIAMAYAQKQTPTEDERHDLISYLGDALHAMEGGGE